MPIRSVVKAAIPSCVRESIRTLLNACTSLQSRALLASPSIRSATDTQSRLCTSHLDEYLEQEAMGPIQQSEALLLFAMVRVTQPRVVVEFGFSQGNSALNFLRALPSTSTVYSYDISEMSRSFARELASKYPNFHYCHKSQTNFSPSDVGDQPVDFVFLDAAHDLCINQATWHAIEPALANDAIIAVHDTGTWQREHFLPTHEELSRQNPDRWLNSVEYQHQVGEREFVNWVVTSTNFVAVHLHTSKMLRHGLTILQKRRLLPTAMDSSRAPTAVDHARDNT